MRPPVLAEALVAAAAPQTDYQILLGDLHEEYLRFALLDGVRVANRWYWSQALRSIPSLLSYSRWNLSAIRIVGIALSALAVLASMLFVLAMIETVSPSLVKSMHQGPTWAWVSLEWIYAATFGAILALIVRTDGLRVAFWSALFLVLCFVIPALAGNPHSQAPLRSWILLWGAIPAMCTGAGLYQAVRRRVGAH